MIKLRIFGPFVKMVERLPGKAIVQALEAEYRMIQSDFERKYPLTEDAQSILYFREFVQAAKFGSTVYFTRPFPPEHCEFYRQIVVRLIDADELPQEALENFDKLFAPIRFALAA